MLLVLALAAQIVSGEEIAARDTRRTISARDGIIRARDIAAASPAGDAIVMKFPQGFRALELSESKRRELLLAQFPGGRFTLRQSGPLRVVRGTGTTPRSRICFVSRTEIAKGETVEKGGLAPTACRTDAPRHRLSYDADAGALVAQAAVPAGSYLGALKFPASVAARKGVELVYRTSEGPVSVERKVVALQTGHTGRRIFVRTLDGRVLSSTLASGDDW